jgi:pimeloyl-ACP methyl ester carboxylesterase
MFARLSAPFLVACLIAIPAIGDGPQDNQPDNVRPIPPRGNPLPDAVREEIKKGLAELQQLITDAGNHALLPDVQIYEKAVRWALDYDEVYDAKGTKTPGGNVKRVLAAGLERATQLKDGKTPWTTQTGPVLRGYRSKIDGSVQPYWMIVPADYDFKGHAKHRLDFWWHGRGETLSEANFMASPANAQGIIPVPGAFILHPYGRYCNANKFAGEVDTFECLDHARKHYRIDENRLVARGFSMGGAACWQFAVHYPTLWAAAAPGAGFAETPEFLNNFQNEKVKPTWYEERLWRLYNATDYAQNLFNLPTVAYSGADDRQKQAADVMAREMKKVGLELTHVIGPKTGHSYEKGAKEEVNKLIDAIVSKGKPAVPKEIKFVTYTLRYNKCGPVTITELLKHWEPATITLKHDGNVIDLDMKGVRRFTIDLPKGEFELRYKGKWFSKPMGSGGEQKYAYSPNRDAIGGDLGEIGPVDLTDPETFRKRPGLQGPIDDAFMDAFLNVAPTGQPLNAKTGEWSEKEMQHAADQWRKQFRGDAPMKKDTEVTDEDIANNNLVLWGDAQSNKVLGRIAAQLPAKWITHVEKKDGKDIKMTEVVLGDGRYPADTHVPVLIYPNPLNPKKYVVLNSGFTFREYDQLNNARQVPKLPDYAVIDVTTPPNSRFPGKVVRAGFFGERWELLPDDGR